MQAREEPLGSFQRFEASERLRRRRTLVSTAVVVPIVAAVLLFPARRPPWADEAARRFGMAGPTRIVAEIQLRQPEESRDERPGSRPDLEAVELERPAGAPAAARAPTPGPAPGENRPPRLLVDDTPGEVLRRTNLPVVQSEDLVIETLVRPVYPHEARVQGLEAIVEAVALVDEEGRVRSVEIVSNTGHEMFAQASREAVRRCHFQPYREGGKASPVYARFRFNFKLL